MPIFKCTKCGMVENTATSHYWWTVHQEKKPALCSVCDPEIGKWHEEFPRNTPEEIGVILGPDGFLYTPDDEYLARLIQEAKDRPPK